MPSLKLPAALLLPIMLLATACQPKPLVVHPAAPVLPLCLIVPPSLLVTVPNPSWLPSPPPILTNSQPLRCRMPSAVNTSTR